MTYDELYAFSRAFFEAHTIPEQTAILDSHEKCSEPGLANPWLFLKETVQFHVLAPLCVAG